MLPCEKTYNHTLLNKVKAEYPNMIRILTTAYADLSRKAVVRAGDEVQVLVTNSSGEAVSGPIVNKVTLDGIRDAVMKVQLRLGHIIPQFLTNHEVELL